MINPCRVQCHNKIHARCSISTTRLARVARLSKATTQDYCTANKPKQDWRHRPPPPLGQCPCPCPTPRSFLPQCPATRLPIPSPSLRPCFEKSRRCPPCPCSTGSRAKNILKVPEKSEKYFNQFMYLKNRLKRGQKVLVQSCQIFSLTVSNSTTRPSSNTKIRSKSMMVFKRCAITMVVTPSNESRIID